MARTDATGRQVARTQATIDNYRNLYQKLCKAADLKPGDYQGMVRWFSDAHERWERATISQYRAAIVQAIEDGRYEFGAAQSERLFVRLAQGPRPRKKGAPRTSARKRKSIPRDEFASLIDCLINARGQDDDRLAARLVNHNVRLFLRPGEWATAGIQDGFLVITNGKATNGRSLG